MNGETLKVGDVIQFKGNFCVSFSRWCNRAEVVGFGRSGEYFARLFASEFQNFGGQLVTISAGDYWFKIEGRIEK